ncbi:MAG: acyl-CoA synthetase [Thermodesulfobacteriota bacterium]
MTPIQNSFSIREIKDIEEIETIPLPERIKEQSTFDLLEKGAQINPEAIAISFLPSGELFDRPVQIPYSRFISNIRKTANMLHDMGVGPTDVVTYLLPSIPETHYVLWGAETAGIANPVNPMLEAPVIADICRAAGTKILVALGETPGFDIWTKVETIRKNNPQLKVIIRVNGTTDEQEGIFGYEETVGKFNGQRLHFDRIIHSEDIASIYHTGGTTGRPKLALRSHGNELALNWGLSSVIGLNPGEGVMVGLPLFHCNGTCITGLLPFSLGGQVVILSPNGYRDPNIIKNFYRIVEKFKPVFFSCVPTVLSMLLDTPVGSADISSLRHLICGAAPLSVELFRRFEAHSKMKILEGYGLTESTCASAVNPKDGERRIGSVGLRVPYQKIKVAVLDQEGQYQRDALPGEIGSVCIYGPTVFQGYIEKEHNQGIWIDGDWFNTGDLGRMDEEGYLWLTGRKKELIIRGGHNIDPASIEEPLYKLEGIKMAAAVGQPDPHAGEVPVVYVEARQDVSFSEGDILNWARTHIGERAAVPKAVYLLDHIPLTAVGKIFKPALKWDAIRRVYENELNKIKDWTTSVKVLVGEDKTRGTSVSIKIKLAVGVPAEKVQRVVREILSRYTVHYHLLIEDDTSELSGRKV